VRVRPASVGPGRSAIVAATLTRTAGRRRDLLGGTGFDVAAIIPVPGAATANEAAPVSAR
jgi:hypothetical protein